MKVFLFGSLSLLLGFVLVAPISAEEPTRVDVMIVYTPAVTEFYNGHDGVMAHLLATMAGTNAALENSDASMFFQLVHAAEVDYVEADNLADDLDRLRLTSDGYMDEIHDWRDEWGADLVSLFRRGSAGSAAGRANLLTHMNGTPRRAFSVVSDVSALSAFVFAHELGHNLGAAHAHGDPGSAGVFAYSRGYRFTGQDGAPYRTVMAYSPGTRIAHFSNPAIQYAGIPTGRSAGETDPADVAETFRSTADVVAAYRPGQSFVPEILGEPLDVTVVDGGAPFLTTAVNGVPPLELQWFEGETGDESNPVSGATESVFWPGPLQETTRYWLRVTNPEGVARSRAAKVAVVSEPSGPYPTTAQQSNVQNGYRVTRERWQVIYPRAGYLAGLRVRLWKRGNPGDVRVELLDPDGRRVVKNTIPAANIGGSSSWHSLNIGVFVAPNQPYRIRLTPAGFFSADDDYVIWAGQGGAYPDGYSSIDANVPDYAFTFQLRGTNAWTYPTWLVENRLSGTEAKPDYAEFSGGAPNLLRYVLNLDSAAGGGGMPSAGTPTTIDGDPVFPIRFRQRKGVQDVSIRVESSSDLAEWEKVDAGEIVQLPDADSETETFEARVPVGPDENSRFLRVKASLPE